MRDDHYWAKADEDLRIPADIGLLANDDFYSYPIKVLEIRPFGFGTIVAYGWDGSFTFRPDSLFLSFGYTYLDYLIIDEFATYPGKIKISLDPTDVGDVANLVLPDGNRAAVASDPGTYLENVGHTGDLPAPLPDGVTLPLGLFHFEVHGVPPGGSATVRMLFEGALPFNAVEYWKYGPTASDSGDHWYQLGSSPSDGSYAEFRDTGYTDATDSYRTGIILHLRNGGFGDSTGPDDDVIVDPGGPAIRLAIPPIDGGPVVPPGGDGGESPAPVASVRPPVVLVETPEIAAGAPGTPMGRSAPPRVDRVVLVAAPWRRAANRVEVSFNREVTLRDGAFKLVGQAGQGRRPRRRGRWGAPAGSWLPRSWGRRLSVATEVVDGRTVATLSFLRARGGAGPIPPGRLRLTVRGDRVEGPAGQPLDGDGDGVSGGDFRTSFRRALPRPWRLRREIR